MEIIQLHLSSKTVNVSCTKCFFNILLDSRHPLRKLFLPRQPTLASSDPKNTDFRGLLRILTLSMYLYMQDDTFAETLELTSSDNEAIIIIIIYFLVSSTEKAFSLHKFQPWNGTKSLKMHMWAIFSSFTKIFVTTKSILMNCGTKLNFWILLSQIKYLISPPS